MRAALADGAVTSQDAVDVAHALEPALHQARAHRAQLDALLTRQSRGGAERLADALGFHRSTIHAAIEGLQACLPALHSAHRPAREEARNVADPPSRSSSSLSALDLFALEVLHEPFEPGAFEESPLDDDLVGGVEYPEPPELRAVEPFTIAPASLEAPRCEAPIEAAPAFEAPIETELLIEGAHVVDARLADAPASARVDPQTTQEEQIAVFVDRLKREGAHMSSKGAAAAWQEISGESVSPRAMAQRLKRLGFAPAAGGGWQRVHIQRTPDTTLRAHPSFKALVTFFDEATPHTAKEGAAFWTARTGVPTDTRKVSAALQRAGFVRNFEDSTWHRPSRSTTRASASALT